MVLHCSRRPRPRLVAPHSKFILFKSPWGNRSIPSALIDGDTVKMRTAKEPEMCGWFYTAVQESQGIPDEVFFSEVTPKSDSLKVRPSVPLELALTQLLQLTF